MGQQTRRWGKGFSPTRLRRLIGPIVIGFVLIVAFIVLIKDSQRLLTFSFHLDPLLVLLSFVVECSGLVLVVPVWHQILVRFGSRLSYRDDLRIYCYSMLGNTIPGGVWSLVSRAALYERQGVTSMRVAVASVVESVLIGLAGLVVYGLTAVLVSPENIWQQPGIALAITAFVVVWIQPPVFNWLIGWLLSRLRQADEPVISLRYADLGCWLALESLVVVIGGIAVYVLLHGFATVPAGMFFFVINAWAVAAVAGNLFFWIPGKLIVRDSAMAFILMQSLPASVAVVFVLLIRVWTIVSILIVAGLAWLFLGRNLHPWPITLGDE